MSLLTMENPVFVTYAVAAALMILKIMAQGWMTVYRMLKVHAGWAAPEDLRVGILNRAPSPEQLESNEYVERSRRMHRNDLENIPAFLAAGLLFVTVAPPYWLAAVLMYAYVISRLVHAVAYATAQSHEVRSTLWTIGSVIVIFMALYVLSVAIF